MLLHNSTRALAQVRGGKKTIELPLSVYAVNCILSLGNRFVFIHELKVKKTNTASSPGLCGYVVPKPLEIWNLYITLHILEQPEFVPETSNSAFVGSIRLSLLFHKQETNQIIPIERPSMDLAAKFNPHFKINTQ